MKAEITIGGKTHEEIAVRAAVPADAAGLRVGGRGFIRREGLIAVEDENGRVGYCNTACEVVIAPQFAEAEDFSGGYVAVKFSEEEWGIIDHAGNVLMRTNAPYDHYMQNGYYVLPAENDGLTMCHVEQGEWVYRWTE